MIIIGSLRSSCQTDGESSAGSKKGVSTVGRKLAKKAISEDDSSLVENEGAQAPAKPRRGRKPSSLSAEITAGESDQHPSGELMSVHSSTESQDTQFENVSPVPQVSEEYVASHENSQPEQNSISSQSFSSANHSYQDDNRNYEDENFDASQNSPGNENYSDEDEDLSDDANEFQLAANQILLTFSYSLVSQIRQTARMEGVTPEDIITELVAEGCTKRAFQDAHRPVPSHLMTRTGYVPPDPNGNVAQPSMSHHGQQAQGPGRNPNGHQNNNQRRFNNNFNGNSFGNNRGGSGGGGGGGGNRFNNNRGGAPRPNQGGQNFRGNGQGNGGFNGGGRPFRQNDRGGANGGGQPYHQQAANPNVGGGSNSSEGGAQNENGDLRGFARKQNREQKR